MARYEVEVADRNGDPGEVVEVEAADVQIRGNRLEFHDQAGGLVRAFGRNRWASMKLIDRG